MEVVFEHARLGKICNDHKQMTRKFGAERARVLGRRLLQLLAAGCLEDLRSAPGRCHQLKGDADGLLSLDLDGPFRLIFRPTSDPPPSKSDGGLEWGQVTEVTIVEILDTHEK
jgi:proteic killer suppression protein